MAWGTFASGWSTASITDLLTEPGFAIESHRSLAGSDASAIRQSTEVGRNWQLMLLCQVRPHPVEQHPLTH
jgi:hypothetical protein